jgi:hypothetical protein
MRRKKKRELGGDMKEKKKKERICFIFYVLKISTRKICQPSPDWTWWLDMAWGGLKGVQSGFIPRGATCCWEAKRLLGPSTAAVIGMFLLL